MKLKKNKTVIKISVLILIIVLYLGSYICYRLSERISVYVDYNLDYSVYCTYYAAGYPTHPRADSTLEFWYFPLYCIEVAARMSYVKSVNLILN